jgi:hypothetical protein
LFLLSDIITYVRRIVKSPSNAILSDNLIIDYINRFYISDVDARIQLFDLKSKYQFETTPAWDRYNMPLYNIQTEGGQNVGMYPVYQGFVGPARINGIPVQFQTQRNIIDYGYFNVVQNQQVVARGNGGPGPYILNFPIGPGPIVPPINPPYNGIIRGHVNISGIISIYNGTGNNNDPPQATNSDFAAILGATPVTSIDSAVFITATLSDGSNVEVRDSGIFLQGNLNYGMLMTPGQAPFGNAVLPPSLGNPAYSTTSNTINYLNGTATVIFPVSIPQGANINVQCCLFQSGLPRSVFYYDNTLTLRSPPAFQYLVELDAYLSPAAFLNTGDAIPFGYMAEYIARGAARKILSDTGDVEQFQFYEPLFDEQEKLVWKRSQRQWTANRTETLYSLGNRNNGSNDGFGNNNMGGY